MLTFEAHSRCEKCDLHYQAFHRGLPTRPIDGQSPDFSRQAVLITGQAPGYQEDRTGKMWVGKDGKLLDAMLEKSELPQHADIYLSNACRCWPPKNDVTAGQIHACCPYLHEDIAVLQAAYPGRLILLLAGAPACRSVLDCSLGVAMEHQSQDRMPYAPAKQQKAGLPKIEPLPCYATYNPAYVRTRKPAAIYAVRDHLLLLKDHLIHPEKRHRPIADAPVPSIAPRPQAPMPKLVSLDIETYGALKMFEQTVFHPVKSCVIDGIKPADLVQIVSLGWYDRDGQETCAVFNFQNSTQRAALIRWLASAAAVHADLIGQNICFDLSYLRYVNDQCRQILRSCNFDLQDVILWNFLHSENRPERALKPLAKLFALGDYGPQKWDYTGPDDPRIIAYGGLDAVVNLRARALLLKAIAHDYGENSPKLSTFCAQHCSELLWTVLHMTEVGVPAWLPSLRSRDARLLRATELVAERAKHDFDLIIRGPGSKKSLQTLVDGAADAAGLLSPKDDRLLLTEKTREVSTRQENITLLISELPDDEPEFAPTLRLLSKFRDHAKLQNTYTGPLLHKPIKGIVTVTEPRGRTYPTWYPCPSKHDQAAEAEKTGGTIQARITCRKFPWQTAPFCIKRTICSRWDGGTLLVADLSQIELRIAALLSGDPVMLDEYARGVDRHAATGDLIHTIFFPSEGPGGLYRRPKDDPTRLLLRYVGKQVNFLTLYGGQAAKLRETVVADAGKKIVALGLPLPTQPQCQSIINAFDQRYIVLRSWQNDLVEEAISQGYLELLSGWSRIYLGGRRRLSGKDRAMILDFPVQAIAAQFLQGSQGLIRRRLERTGSRIVMPLQIYDAVYLDCPPGQVGFGKKILTETLPCPPLLAIIEEELGRTVPITYDCKEVRHEAIPEEDHDPG